DRGDQARDSRPRGPGDRRQSKAWALEEARGRPLRARFRQRDRSDLVTLAGIPRLGGVRKVEVRPTARANLHVELQDLVAARAPTLGLILLPAVKQRRDQAKVREHRTDQKPEPKGAPLGPPH